MPVFHCIFVSMKFFTMRCAFLIVFLFPTLLMSQQRYISSAIIAYTGGAYERAIRDLNSALENPEKLAKEEAAKAYYYRALARMKLAASNSASIALGNNPYLAANADLRNAVTFDAINWANRVQGINDELFEGLWRTGREAFTKASYVKSIDHFRAAAAIKTTFDLISYLGKAYEALGESYTRSQSTRDVANYRAALNYLEEAIKLEPSCIECARSLVNVSSKLNDQERVKKYQQLLDSLNSR